MLAVLQCYIQQLQELRRIEQQLLPPPPPSPAASGSSATSAPLPRLRSIDQLPSPLALVRTGTCLFYGE